MKTKKDVEAKKWSWHWLGWTVAAIGLFLSPAILSTSFNRIIHEIGISDPNDWFARNGQYGDQFGLITCIAAMIAAFFTYKTLVSQREMVKKHEEEAAKSEQERHFFKLHEDFERALVRAREKGAEPRRADMLGTQYVAMEMTLFISTLTTEERTAGISDEELNRRVCHKISVSDILNTFMAFPSVVYKFDIAKKYLDEISNSQSDGRYDLYYRALITSLNESEVCALSALLMCYHWRGVTGSDAVPKGTVEVMNIFAKHAMNTQLSPQEVMMALRRGHGVANRIFTTRHALGVSSTSN